MANGHGGKRSGSGVPKGSHNRKAIKDGTLVVHSPRMIELAKQWLYGDSPEDQKWAFDRLMPYVFRKQPQEVEHNPLSLNVNFNWGTLPIDELARIRKNPELALAQRN